MRCFRNRCRSPQTRAITKWLLEQQHVIVHRYTNAAPGGWAWTNLSGGVPDADDTPGAILALLKLDRQNPAVASAVEAAIEWLLNLQNSDGGWPTFCRGWGALPFDRSTPDLTAHTLRAFRSWLTANDPLPANSDGSNSMEIGRLSQAVPSAERRDYSSPVAPPTGRAEQITRRREWHRVEAASGPPRRTGGGERIRLSRKDAAARTVLGCRFGLEINLPTTTRTRSTECRSALAAYRDWNRLDDPVARRAVAWLASVQNSDGGWGGAADTPSSTEETALAVEALLPITECAEACQRGLDWLLARIDSGRHFRNRHPSDSTSPSCGILSGFIQ